MRRETLGHGLIDDQNADATASMRVATIVCRDHCRLNMRFSVALIASRSGQTGGGAAQCACWCRRRRPRTSRKAAGRVDPFRPASFFSACYKWPSDLATMCTAGQRAMHDGDGAAASIIFGRSAPTTTRFDEAIDASFCLFDWCRFSPRARFLARIKRNAWVVYSVLFVFLWMLFGTVRLCAPTANLQGRTNRQSIAGLG